MITRGQEPTDAPASPSPRATTAPSGSETQATSLDVVDVMDGGEAWTATSARRVVDPPPLHASKRATSKPISDGTLNKAQNGKKKVAKRASPAPMPTEPEKSADRAPAVNVGARREGTSKTGEETEMATIAREPGDASREDGFDLSEFMASFQPGTASVTVPPVTADPLLMVPSPPAAPEGPSVVALAKNPARHIRNFPSKLPESAIQPPPISIPLSTGGDTKPEGRITVSQPHVRVPPRMFATRNTTVPTALPPTSTQAAAVAIHGLGALPPRTAVHPGLTAEYCAHRSHYARSLQRM
ncbi:LOW QUALITY PROTEIN: hypothetical protein PHMEG_00021867 [Phytophthora megakarya]|uniref:Uncharacterized protein n=1 Tax=Phytophthora megakarya TaxID=4795 RepID=A0A225VKK8_9STRA|nr:LOW QUALITY PROTEIN: hypothetical protein PHMEG_00021867 [Phytophthora megakarya]